jgi:hypothetical protein
VPVTSRVLPAALVGLLVAGAGSFAIGRATAEESDSPDGAKVENVGVPAGVTATPTLRDVGQLPALRPAPSTGGSVAPAPSQSSTPESPAPAAPSPGPAPVAPAPSQPAPAQPAPSEPAPPEPVAPG